MAEPKVNAHKATVALLQILLILAVEIWLTSRGWNALEGWLVAGGISLLVSVLDEGLSSL